MQHLNKDIKVTKDFLLKNDFDNIFRLASSSDFSWFYQPEHNPNAKDGFFFLTASIIETGLIQIIMTEL